MNRFFAMNFCATLIVSIAITPVFAAGGKQRGAVGKGNVDQGERADAPGDNAQENQAP